MEKLNRTEREKIAKVLIKSISKLCDAPCGASADDIEYEEMTVKKSHSVLCVLLAYKLGLLERRKGELIDIDCKLGLYFMLANQTGELSADFYDEIIKFYDDVDEKSRAFLYEVFSHSSWEIEEVEDYFEIDCMTDKEIDWYKDMIPILFAHIKADENRYPCNEDLEALTDRLEEKGVDTEYYFEMDECKILSLRNPKIKKAVDLCKQNEAMKALPEYEEIESYLDIFLLIRRYACFDKIKDDGDMFYILGTCYSDHYETVATYHLVWETVILLIFAEWAAEEILEYAREKGESTECLKKQV